MRSKSGKPPKIKKSTSSAMVLSILIHAVLFLLAGMLVIFTVTKVKEPEFEPPKTVKRPKMKLKKPKVKVKRSTRPKSATRITTTRQSTMPQIDLPAMGGLGAGLGDGMGGGFDMMPDLGEVSVFGGSQSIGNDFKGHCYFFKYKRDGGLAVMSSEQFLLLLRKFCVSGWREALLAPYYRTPDPLYTTHFMIPPVPSSMAADVFGQPEMESHWFFAKYKGQLVYPEDIRFRFWGVGDAFLVVNVAGKHVLLNGIPGRLRILDFWQNPSGDNDKYSLGNKWLRVGDWIDLKAGQPVDMQILFGEYAGGSMAGMLLVEVEGVEYPQSLQGGPLFPAFKTEEFTYDQLEEIRKYLPEGECSLTNGPVFRDFFAPSKPASINNLTAVEKEPVIEIQPTVAEDKMRLWTLTTGKTIEAEFATLIGDKITLRTPRGKQVKVPEQDFSEADLKRIELLNPPTLSFNFSKSSKQRVFPDIWWVGDDGVPNAKLYDFRATIGQRSTRIYPHDLAAEYFAVGREIDGGNYILLDYQTKSFQLLEGSRSVVELTGKTVELTDYYMQGFHRGERYKGYLIVVTDSRGEIISHKTSSENFFKNLENLRRVPVGKYFDDDCNRTQPTRLKTTRY
jgi:hypothetical protein